MKKDNVTKISSELDSEQERMTPEELLHCASRWLMSQTHKEPRISSLNTLKSSQSAVFAVKKQVVDAEIRKFPGDASKEIEKKES